MKSRSAMFVGVFIILLAGAAAAKDVPKLKTEKEKRSYAIGMDLGTGLKKMSVELDPKLLDQGLRDAMSGGKTMMTPDELRETLTSLQKELKEKEAKTMQQIADKNGKEGEAFLANNKTKEGVVTLASGLQYKILKAGEGNKPTSDNTVECHYKGTLIDGTEFDSSYRRGQPVSFAVKGVISGWTEALQLMPVGSKWQLFIPAKLAYGDKVAGPRIGPNSTLLFEVELLGIK